MINKDKYFKFYNSCIPVKGYNRGIVYDLQRGSIFFIPNTVIEMLEDNSTNKLKSIYKEYTSSKDLVTKYFNYLIENELVFLTDEPDNFSELSYKYEKPFTLDILFIEIDDMQDSKLKLFKQIDLTGCTQIILIFKNNASIELLIKVLEILKKSRLQIINLISKHTKNIEEIRKLRYNYPRLRNILFFDAKKERTIDDGFTKITTNNFQKTLTRTISDINDFVLNLESFIEAKNFNLFFNRKIYIDNQGNIKNYVNDDRNHGNINETSLLKVISQKSIQNLWSLTKDKIEECSNCEFRYICPDNRIPFKRNDKYIHKTKCNYDPKTNQWK